MKPAKTDSKSATHEITDPDQQCFREAMRDVTPLTSSKNSAPLPAHPPPQRRIRRSAAPPPTLPDRFAFSDHQHLAPVSGEEHLFYTRGGISHKALRNLRNGQYTSEAFLDLHGLTGSLAREALADFLAACLHEGKRHVIIIHGKGNPERPILKNCLNHWLRQPGFVLAFCTAKPRDGGNGAVYVLLAKST